MPLGGPGPRDWSPPEYADPARSRGSRHAYASRPSRSWSAARPGRAPWALLLFALLLGIAAAVVGLTEPATDHSRGYLVSTIGITAIVLGVRVAVRTRGRSSLWRFFGVLAAVLGGVGSALMLYAVVATGLVGHGITLPSISLRPDSAIAGAPVSVPTAVPTARTSSGSTAAAGTTSASGTDGAAASAQEAASLQASAVGLANAMRQDFGEGPFPASLVLTNGVSPEIALPSGAALASLPAGDRLVYSRSTDGTAWNVTLIGGVYGHVTTYDSTVGIVHTQ